MHVSSRHSGRRSGMDMSQEIGKLRSPSRLGLG